MKNRLVYYHAFQGLVLSQGAPLGWYLCETLIGKGVLPGYYVYLYMSLGTAVVFSLFGAYMGHKEDLLSSLVVKDPLTQLFNKAYFNERLEEELAKAERNKEPLCLVMMDIDHFKKINDKYGHRCGDEVLVAVANALRETCRHNEVAARVGGEEFCILLSTTNSSRGLIAAQRFKNSVDKLSIKTPEGLIKPKLSLGVCSTLPQKSREYVDIYARADQAMYAAKLAGRNRIRYFEKSEAVACSLAR